jgi:hypothetical protein
MGTRTLTYRASGPSPLTASSLISVVAEVQRAAGAHVPLERITLEVSTGDPDRGDTWYIRAIWPISTPGE